MPDETTHRIKPHKFKFARNLRQNQSPAEIKLWSVLRNNQVEGLKFRRQVPIGSFIADFYCASAKLVIEIDGGTHADQENYDLQRTQWLNKNGVRVIRFTNRDVRNYLNDVVIQIFIACKRKNLAFRFKGIMLTLTPTLPLEGGGSQDPSLLGGRVNLSTLKKWII